MDLPWPEQTLTSGQALAGALPRWLLLVWGRSFRAGQRSCHTWAHSLLCRGTQS